VRIAGHHQRRRALPKSAADPLAPFRDRAKRLLKRVRRREPAALEAARLHPLLRSGVDADAFALSDAQLVVARQEGHHSWPRLVAAHTKDQAMNVIFNGLGVRLWALPDEFGACADFYRDVLALKCTWRDDGRFVAIYELGFGPTLVVEGSGEGDREKLAGRITGITLGVADVAASYAALKAKGVPFLREPDKQYWGGIMAHFQDPAGNYLTLLEGVRDHGTIGKS
jgi:catechol 2,3-dioxygenase-like lactoylglutathione lyase family enzyme